MPSTAIRPEIKAMPESEYISWEKFREHYLNLEDMYNYEWLDGKVEKTPRSMDRK